MAEGGNSDNKLVMELDLETKLFEIKMNGVVLQTNQVTAQGKQAWSGMGASVVMFNQALELAQKAIEAVRFGIEQIEFADKFNNQAKALQNLAASVGVSSKTLLEGVKKASGESLSDLEANRIAFDALNSGIQAKNIPTLTKLASAYSDSGRVAKSTEQIMADFARAIETGNTAMLKQYGISKVSSDRMAALNAVLTDGTREVSKLGDSFDSTGQRATAALSNMWEASKKLLGESLSDIAKPFLMTDVEKGQSRVQALEKDLERVNEQIKNGAKEWELANSAHASGMKVSEARVRLEEMLVEARKNLEVTTNQSVQAEKNLNAELEKGTAVEKALTDAQVNRIQLRSQVVALERQAAAESSQQGVAELKTLQELQQAKRRVIDSEAAEQRQLAESKATSAADLEGRLIAIEERRRARVQQIAQEEQATNETRRNAEILYLEQNAMTNDQYMQRKVDRETQQEVEMQNRRVMQLQMEVQDKEQFNQQLQQSEEQHQQRLQQIRDQYHGISQKNFQNGVNQSLATMRNQYGNFTAITQRGMMQTHGIMTRGFVNMAKGHKDAMDQMLKQFLEMIGTEMIQAGTFHLLKGIASLNPQEMGAGAALIGAGMAIVGAAGPGAGAAGDAGGGGYGGGAMGQQNITQAGPEDLERKSAKIIINGDYLNSQETANHLAEVLRKNSDVTDYAIVAQGRNYA